MGTVLLLFFIKMSLQYSCWLVPFCSRFKRFVCLFVCWRWCIIVERWRDFVAFKYLYCTLHIPCHVAIVDCTHVRKLTPIQDFPTVTQKQLNCPLDFVTVSKEQEFHTPNSRTECALIRTINSVVDFVNTYLITPGLVSLNRESGVVVDAHGNILRVLNYAKWTNYLL